MEDRKESDTFITIVNKNRKGDKFPRRTSLDLQKEDVLKNDKFDFQEGEQISWYEDDDGTLIDDDDYFTGLPDSTVLMLCPRGEWRPEFRELLHCNSMLHDRCHVVDVPLGKVLLVYSAWTPGKTSI